VCQIHFQNSQDLTKIEHNTLAFHYDLLGMAPQLSGLVMDQIQSIQMFTTYIRSIP